MFFTLRAEAKKKVVPIDRIVSHSGQPRMNFLRAVALIEEYRLAAPPTDAARKRESLKLLSEEMLRHWASLSAEDRASADFFNFQRGAQAEGLSADELNSLYLHILGPSMLSGSNREHRDEIAELFKRSLHSDFPSAEGRSLASLDEAPLPVILAPDAKEISHRVANLPSRHGVLNFNLNIKFSSVQAGERFQGASIQESFVAKAREVFQNTTAADARNLNQLEFYRVQLVLELQKLLATSPENNPPVQALSFEEISFRAP